MRLRSALSQIATCLQHIVFLICGFFPFALTGQQGAPNFVRYGPFNGLPSVEVYQLLQDNEGYIWATTDRGVVRIDGNNGMMTLTTLNGLYDDAVYGLHEDALHRLWFFGHSGRLSYWKDGKIHNPAFNDTLLSLVGPNLLQYLVSDSLGHMYLGMSRKEDVIKIDNNGLVLLKGDLSVHEMSIYDYKHTAFYYSTPPLRRSDNEEIRIKIYNDSGAVTVKCATIKPLSGGKMTAIKLGNGDYAVVVGNQLLRLNGRQQVSGYTIDGVSTVSLYEDREQNLWIGTYKNGVFCFLKGDLSLPPLHYLKEYSISSIYQDNEYGYWFTTLDAGIFYTSTLAVHTFNRHSVVKSPVISATWDNNRLIVNTRSNALYTVEERQNNWETTATQYNGVSFEKSLDTTKIVLFTRHKCLRIVPNIPIRHYLFPTRNYLYKNNGKRSVLFGDEVFVKFFGKYLKNTPVEVVKTNLPSWLWLTSVAVIGNTTYIGSSNGLYQVSLNGNSHYLGKNDNQLQVRINDLCVAKDSAVFAATAVNGIVLIKYNKAVVKIEKSVGGLPSNSCNVLCMQGDSILWVGTNLGLCRITLDNNLKPVAYRNITERDGLASNYIISLDISNGKMAVGTDQGFSIWYDQPARLSTKQLQTSISGILINNLERPLASILNLSYKERLITFNYICNQYKNAGNHLYRYRVNAGDSQWVYTHNTSVNLHSLSPGEYTFEVQVQSTDASWSSIPATVRLNISPPFWNTWWAKTTAILLALFSTGGVGIWYVKRERGRHREQMELDHYKSLALRNQMNPHFIFNSLASIQNYLLSNNIKDSVHYLAKFSRLMRITLENSRNTLITVADELKALKMYIEMEKIRSREGFEYSITISKQPELMQWKIPPLLLQPFVENAILHGLLPKPEDRSLKIEIEVRNKMLVCTIEDNGIGREEAKKITTSKKNPSRAMEITANRLRLLGKLYNTYITLTTEDLNKSGKPSGTRVIINIPLLRSENDT